VHASGALCRLQRVRLPAVPMARSPERVVPHRDGACGVRASAAASAAAARIGRGAPARAGGRRRRRERSLVSRRTGEERSAAPRPLSHGPVHVADDRVAHDRVVAQNGAGSDGPVRVASTAPR
jgi:hypothetical protein